MPINCPRDLPGPCLGCRSLNMDGDKCTHFLPPVPIRDILTADERIDQLELTIASWERVVPSRVLAQIRKEFNQLKGENINLRNKLNDHMDRSKKKKKTATGTKKRTVDV